MYERIAGIGSSLDPVFKRASFNCFRIAERISLAGEISTDLEKQSIRVSNEAFRFINFNLCKARNIRLFYLSSKAYQW